MQYQCLHTARATLPAVLRGGVILVERCQPGESNALRVTVAEHKHRERTSSRSYRLKHGAFLPDAMAGSALGHSGARSRRAEADVVNGNGRASFVSVMSVLTVAVVTAAVACQCWSRRRVVDHDQPR